VIDTRIKKAMRDLWLDRSRTAAVVLAIAIGIFCLGTVIVGFSILDRELNVNYLNTNPASAILTLDRVDGNLSGIIKNDPAIRDAELRRAVTARIQTGPDTWRTAILYVPDDFGDVRINAMHLEKGPWPAGRDEISFERLALPMTGKNIGDHVTVKTSNGVARELNITGTVHDPALDPANMAQVIYAYASEETLADLGGSGSSVRLMITVADNADLGSADLGSSNDEAHIRSVAYGLKDRIEREGIHVSKIEVPAPGQHPNANQMRSLMFLFEAFSALSFVLSMILVVNVITGLLARQVRQIGMMKAVGATTGQVMAIYLGGVFVIGVVATALALPASMLVGKGLSGMVAGMMNFEISSDAIPAWVFVVLLGVGLVLPVAAAAYPVYRGSRITVQRAINDYGIGENEMPGPGFFMGLAGFIPGLSRPLQLSIRNTFRRRERLALTLLTLAVGGAMFMVALSLLSSMDATVDNSLDTRNFNYIVTFADYHPAGAISGSLSGVPGVGRVECIASKTVTVTGADGTDSNPFTVLAVPPETGMIRYPIVDGRWLRAGDQGEVILNHVLVSQLKEHGTVTDVKAGDDITLNLNGTKSTWHVAGIVREIMAPPRAYVNYSYFAGMAGTNGLANAAAIALAGEPVPSDGQKTGDGSGTVVPLMEKALRSDGLNVSAVSSLGDMRTQMKEHLAVIAAFVIFMSGMTVVVGMLSLTSTMSINIVERRREIGVMRAIGASGRTITGLIAAEALVIGLMSWLIAAVVATPLSYAIGSIFGTFFFKSPLDIALSPSGMLLWLALVAVLAPAASLLSAWNAARLPVQEVVAYE